MGRPTLGLCSRCKQDALVQPDGQHARGYQQFTCKPCAEENRRTKQIPRPAEEWPS